MILLCKGRGLGLFKREPCRVTGGFALQGRRSRVVLKGSARFRVDTGAFVL
jgi:hypothetical protein